MPALVPVNEPDAEAPEAPDDDTVFVLNVLWFTPGGAERYQEYLAAAGPLVEARGGRFLDPFTPIEAWEGPIDADLVFFGRYPSREALLDMLASDEYAAIAHLRDEAVDRSFTTLCGASWPPRSSSPM